MLVLGLAIPRPTRRKQAWTARLRSPLSSRNLTSVLSRTTQPPSLAGPATPASATAGPGRPSPRRGSTGLGVGPATRGQPQVPLPASSHRPRRSDPAFAPTPKPDEVLFYLPVTKAWLRQLVLALVLICHSPDRGVVELLRDLFDYPISLGTVHNIVHSAVEPARAISRRYDLAAVRIGAHDEIFQALHPVLVGVDTASTYCYLLSLEDHRDAVTWGVRLLELVDQGFDPEATVADAGSGLRAGQALALPEVPCRGDIFHILRDLEELSRLSGESRLWRS